MPLSRRRLLSTALLLPAAACLPLTRLWAGEPDPDRRTAVIHTEQGPQRLKVEIADTPALRERGLMGRERLGRDEGMLFVYAAPQPGSSGFWMYRTLIPLDIAFIDAHGRIVNLITMPPCTSPDPVRCPAYPPDVPYTAALEVNAGYFAQRGIRPGDCVSSALLDGNCADS